MVLIEICLRSCDQNLVASLSYCANLFIRRLQTPMEAWESIINSQRIGTPVAGQVLKGQRARIANDVSLTFRKQRGKP